MIGSKLVAIVAVTSAVGTAAGPLQVFILAGQSNMEGQAQMGIPGAADNVNGSLAWLAQHNPAEFGFAVTDGNWTVRNDVFVWTNENGSVDANVSSQGSFGNLSTGYGCKGQGPYQGHQIGPEYGFGFTVGDALKDQVLLIKTAWGGKTLAVDFRSPTAVQKRGGTVGFYYTRMLADVRQALGDLTTLFPAYDPSTGYQIAGFLWDQGWNDGCSVEQSQDYEANMADLIVDIRQVQWGNTSSSRNPKLPVSIPVSSFGGLGTCTNPSNECNQPDRRHWVVAAQFAVANETKHPELGSVAARDPGPFYVPVCPAELLAQSCHNQTSGAPGQERWSPADMIYHWNQNAYTYWNIGRLGGAGMLSVLPKAN